MQATLFSLFMSVIWSSALAVFNYCCRKKHFFIRQLGSINLLFLYVFSIVRLLVPYKFSCARAIPAQGAFYDFCESAAQRLILPVLPVVWVSVSAALMLRFLIQYQKAMTGFLACGICEDAQCRRVFNRVLNQSKKEMKITIRRSEDISIPIGVGLFHKTIILPKEAYSDSELYYILRHEYTHFQNGDLAVKFFMHIYGCMFWWNPVIRLLKKELAQIMEIKCDLDVTAHMKNQDKAGYLTAIVKALKHAEEKRQGKPFYGAAAFVSGSPKMDVVERFQMVSADCGKKKRHLLFTGSWFLAFGILIFLSFSFAIQSGDETLAYGSGTAAERTETTIGASYRIKCIDGVYHIYFQGN